MEEKLHEVLKDFNLGKALLLTDKMHELDAMRQLTDLEEELWEELTIKIERTRLNSFFF
jgi:hypothetical protein